MLMKLLFEAMKVFILLIVGFVYLVFSIFMPDIEPSFDEPKKKEPSFLDLLFGNEKKTKKKSKEDLDFEEFERDMDLDDILDDFDEED